MKRRQIPQIPNWLAAAAGLALAVMAVLSVRTGQEMLQRIDRMSTATADSMQWTLAQAEVEYLKLLNAALAAGDGESLVPLRRFFDIFYNRVTLVQESGLYAGLQQEPDAAALLAELQRRLDRWALWIDGGGDALRGRLPDLALELSEAQDEVRRLSLLGVTKQAEASGRTREEFYALLMRLAVSVLTLLAVLALTSLLLLHLYRRGRRLGDERARAAARLEAMIASSLDAVLVAGPDGRVQAFNGAAETIFGYSAKEAVGANLADLVVPDHLRAAHERGVKRLLETGEARVAGKGRVQLEAKRKSGTLFPAELSVEMCSSGGEEVFVSYVRDISDRVAAEENLRRARDEALAGERAKANLITVMSHEMRTPLSGILSSLDLLEEAVPDPENLRYIEAMRQSGERLLGHVDDVLELSRLDSGTETEPPRVFDLEEFLERLAASLQDKARDQGNTLELHCSLGRSPGVAGRPRALERALLNIIGNALKFTRGGKVTIDVCRAGSSDMVEFQIADTGPGIDKEDLERIFDEFVRLDASYKRGSEGTGLGLAITRRIVAGLGGSIGCESEPGKGSLFTVTLPLPAAKLSGRNRPGARQEKDNDEQDAAPAAGRHVLVVDDNAVNRLLLEKLLCRIGHHVTTASGGAEGVEAARSGQFDLILMDISMPDVDGIEALRRIRAGRLAEGTPVVAFTAHTAPEDHARILASGFAEVLTKPVTKQGLSEVIQRRAGGAPAARGGGDADIGQFFELLGPDQARQFLARFRAEVTQLHGELEAAGQLTEDQRKEAHRLAGSAAVLGLEELRSCMLGIEEAEEPGPPPVQMLARAWEEADEVISPYLSA